MLCLALCDLLYVLLRSTNMSEAIFFFIIIVIFLSLFTQGSTTCLMRSHFISQNFSSINYIFLKNCYILSKSWDKYSVEGPIFQHFPVWAAKHFWKHEQDKSLQQFGEYNQPIWWSTNKIWDTFSLIDQLISLDESITEMRWCSYTTL